MPLSRDHRTTLDELALAQAKYARLDERVRIGEEQLAAVRTERDRLLAKSESLADDRDEKVRALLTAEVCRKFLESQIEDLEHQLAEHRTHVAALAREIETAHQGVAEATATERVARTERDHLAQRLKEVSEAHRGEISRVNWLAWPAAGVTNVGTAILATDGFLKAVKTAIADKTLAPLLEVPVALQFALAAACFIVGAMILVTYRRRR